MAIDCAYCDGEHDSPADIRQCWADGGKQAVPMSDSIDIPADSAAEDGSNQVPDEADGGPAESIPDTARQPQTAGEAKRHSEGEIVRGVAVAVAGPDLINRNVVHAPGVEVPPEWKHAESVVIDADAITDPTEVLRRLRSAAAERERLVIELAVDFDRRPKLMTTATPYEVGPTFAFDLDELHHLVWANTIDGREPARLTWLSLDVAVAAGATPVPAGAIGDVVTPSGEAVWLDGGPMRYTPPIDGVPVVHAVAIEHGSFDVPRSNKSTADLAPDQLAAVTHSGGGARIIAPAGSGKTRVLTERARHLVRQWNLPPSAVSLVAFNKRAQEEMKERTTDLPGLQVRTLNAIALAIVNGSPPFARQAQSWKTIGEPDVRRIIGDLVSFPRRRNSDPVAPWIEALSAVRLGLAEPSEVEQRYDGDVDGLAAIWPAYRDRLEREGAVDFDDQIYRALGILLGDPDARRTAQRACRVMLVDEFQDLTPAHLLLIRMLSAPGGAVFGVGDDDQTIYGYNGADPGWLIDFASLFPGSGEHPLEVNYRCPAGTVEVVDRLLRHNDRRVAKKIRAASIDPGGWSVSDGVDSVGATVAAVESAISAGAPTDDVAVLARVNAVLAPVQVALTAAGVPICGGVGLEFLDRTAIRTVLAWVRLSTTEPGQRGRFDPADIREALRRPSRSFHPRITDWVSEQQTLVDLHKLASRLNKERDSERVIEFAADIEVLQQMVRKGSDTSEILFALIDQIGLAGSIAGLDANRRGMNRAAQGDDLTAIQHMGAQHDDPASFENWIRTSLAVQRSAGGVLLSTVHRVKGQEWPHVVVHFADAEQYPHRLADDVEEERRLFHVAITRASTHATIVTGGRPSPFIAELTTEPSARRVVRSHSPEPPEPTPTANRSRSRTDPLASLDDAGCQRYEALRELRNELRDGKPAYVVFTNATLAAIAEQAPSSLTELSQISGVGPTKLDKYGTAVIDLVTRLNQSA